MKHMDAYRADLVERIKDVREQIELYESGRFFTQERRGDGEWQDSTQANLAYHRRTLDMYEGILRSLADRNS